MLFPGELVWFTGDVVVKVPVLAMGFGLEYFISALALGYEHAFVVQSKVIA